MTRLYLMKVNYQKKKSNKPLFAISSNNGIITCLIFIACRSQPSLYDPEVEDKYYKSTVEKKENKPITEDVVDIEKLPYTDKNHCQKAKGDREFSTVITFEFLSLSPYFSIMIENVLLIMNFCLYSGKIFKWHNGHLDLCLICPVFLFLSPFFLFLSP